MKKYMLFALLTIFLAFGKAHAQSVGMTVEVPFDFVAGDVMLHAGKYTIQTVGVTGDSLLLRNVNLKEAVLLSPTVLESGHRGHNQLVFKVEGSHYYLWQISTTGDNLKRELPVKLREDKPIADTKGSTVVTVASLGR